MFNIKAFLYFPVTFLMVSCHTTQSLYHSSHPDDNSYLWEETVEKTVTGPVEDLCMTAESLYGAPYRYGGCDPEGFDCSGYIRYVFSTEDYDFPRSSREQSRIGKKITLDDIAVADLVFFGRSKVNHVAMVTDIRNGEIFISHSTSSQGVCETNLSQSNYWYSRIVEIRRVIPAGSSQLTSN